MKKRILLILTVSLVGLALLVPAAHAATKKVHRWKLQCDFAVGDYQLMNCTYAFAKTVEKMTNGQIKIKVYSQGQLVSPKESMEALSKGLFQVRTSCAAYIRGKVPWADVEFGMPFAFRNMIDWNRCWFRYGMLDYLKKNYAKMWDVEYICPDPFTGGALLTTKPVKSLADLKGMKIRCVGTPARTWSLVGVSPITMSSKEMYTALSTGVAEGVMYSSMTIETMKLYEVAKYYLLPAIPNLMGGHMLVNRKAWKSLSCDLQKKFLEAAWQHSRCSINVPEEWDKLWPEKAKKYGITVNTLPESDVATIRKACKKVWDDVDKRGPLAKQALDIVRATQRGEGYYKGL